MNVQNTKYRDRCISLNVSENKDDVTGRSLSLIVIQLVNF
jgi:hypothetical protein